jgi:hypothetical protein
LLRLSSCLVILVDVDNLEVKWLKAYFANRILKINNISFIRRCMNLPESIDGTLGLKMYVNSGLRTIYLRDLIYELIQAVSVLISKEHSQNSVFLSFYSHSKQKLGLYVLDLNDLAI